MGEKRLYRTHLRHVDVVVRVHGRLAPDDAAHDLDRAVADHLVHVHVRLRPGPGLPHDEGEVLVEFAFDDFERGGANGGGAGRVQLAQILVHRRRGVLHDGERAQDLHRHLLAADLEVLQRPLRLRAPVSVRGDPDDAHGVALFSERRGRRPDAALHERVDAVRAAVEVRAVRDDAVGLGYPRILFHELQEARADAADLPRFVRGGGRVVMRRVLRHYCALSEGSARAGAGDARRARARDFERRAGVSTSTVATAMRRGAV
eukprot:30923-Pelagococcus_subviridis.AAC.2